uniref:(-)-isopiperitenol/(-)-carveol dehydrogenase, mitochondrial-like n=1 Tax=Tanacetum cinerariifolium TaxID=118510 RepID=A0A699IVG9_TANCI|nr:(-)-isopiperitenol/(-)-carveol dehydrogenase, mitochondrial-like [Tanacetum cinerariifolium]
MATLTDMMSKLVSANTASSSRSGTLPGNTITNPKEELKGITTRSGVAYQGPKTPSPSKQGTKVTKDQVQTPSSQNTAQVQPSVIQSEPQALVSEPVVAPVSAPIPNLKPSILYPSRIDNEKCRDQANEQIKKFYEIFKEMSFKISFMDTLILMPKFASTLKALIENKEKLSEIARTMMNEHCSAVILNKLPRKLGDPGKFLIPSDFVVVDFKPDLRVPLILGRCFLKTSRALIDVHKGELTLRIGNEAITYNLDQTVRYSANYNQMTANKIDVVEAACEEYSQEVLSFSNVTASGTPTPQNDLIVFVTSPTLTPFGDSDFLLFEEADAFLELLDQVYCDQSIENLSVHDVVVQVLIGIEDMISIHNNLIMNKIEGKVAIVTGGASGIGEVTARLFVKHGARVVVIADIQDDLGKKVAISFGSNVCTYIHCDVSDEAQVKSLVDSTVEIYGQLDIMFSNAGIMSKSDQTVLDFDMNEYDRVFAINVRGTAACVKHAARSMVEGRVKGNIICTASVLGRIGMVEATDYGMSKHAVIALMKSASKQLGQYGIRVNCVSPFVVATPLMNNQREKEATEVEKMFQPLTSLKDVILKAEDVAEAVLFLASGESGFITGHDLVIDGGFTL